MLVNVYLIETIELKNNITIIDCIIQGFDNIMANKVGFLIRSNLLKVSAKISCTVNLQLVNNLLFFTLKRKIRLTSACDIHVAVDGDMRMWIPLSFMFETQALGYVNVLLPIHHHLLAVSAAIPCVYVIISSY